MKYSKWFAAGPSASSQAKAFQLLFALASIFMPMGSKLAAQALSAAPKPLTNQIHIRFKPKGERAPLSYELLHGVPVFPAQINGQDVWAMLDDRITGSLIDAQFARSHGLKVAAASGQFRTPTGTLERHAAYDVEVTLPGQIEIDGSFSVVDLSFAAKVTGRPISLIIGKEYFDDLEFLITPFNHEIQVGPSGTLKLRADTPSVVLKNDRPQVDATINGEPVTLTVDLGYQGNVALTDAAWTKLHLTSAGLDKTAHLDGNFEAAKTTTVGEVALGAVQFRDVRVISQRTFAEDADGYIGFGLLSQFNFALDVKGGRLWMISKVK